MAKIETRHTVDAHDGFVIVRLSVCFDSQILKALQGPFSVEQAKRLHADLGAKIKEAECQPAPPRAASSAKTR
jgi:hypothetical protein